MRSDQLLDDRPMNVLEIDLRDIPARPPCRRPLRGSPPRPRSSGMGRRRSGGARTAAARCFGDEAGGDVLSGFVVSVAHFRVRSLRFLPWRDEVAPLAYVTGGAHRTAMPKMSEWGDEASTVRWFRTAPTCRAGPRRSRGCVPIAPWIDAFVRRRE